ncbi:AraC family transcriptional regulator [uncultured Aquimarina sp.]|uniref:helix-turn-helix domain-containing protein n=1 Tax=uncultured Aquimarina sp. TaxID=575652 RepID=UPI0026151EE8|nr:response regulator transcription factor [uncultured Aquimarina sp.]
MDINNQIIDWNSPDILMQIANHIKNPLRSILEASSKIVGQKRGQDTTDVALQNHSTEIIISNTKELSKLINEVVKAAQSKSVNVADKEVPTIFKIYQSNTTVQSKCKVTIDASHISKSDHSWLFNFENLVFKQIKNGQMNLYDLSFALAISERQLHRKIKNLVGLTPNKYIRVLRLYKAKQLIDQYIYDTISEVSYEIGYFDTHYFSKLFYQQYGTSPKELLASKRLIE